MTRKGFPKQTSRAAELGSSQDICLNFHHLKAIFSEMPDILEFHQTRVTHIHTPAYLWLGLEINNHFSL